MKTKGMIAAMVLIALTLTLGACSSQPTTGMTSESVVINAPPDKVFAFIEDGQNALKINPNMKELNCEGTGLNKQCTWRIENFDEVYQGRTFTTDFVPNRKIEEAGRTDDGRVALVTTTLVLPHPQGTKLVRVGKWIHVEIPAVLSKLPQSALQKKMDEGLKEELQKIKEEVEKM